MPQIEQHPREMDPETPFRERMIQGGKWSYQALRESGIPVSIHYRDDNFRWIQFSSKDLPQNIPHIAINSNDVSSGQIDFGKADPLEVHTRVAAFIRGFGIKALEYDDWLTAFNALDAITPGGASQDENLKVPFENFTKMMGTLLSSLSDSKSTN